MRFDTGIGPIGHVECGSHFCHFYKTAEDLAETLVPFFKTGLDAHERCIWVAADPFPKERALAALNTHTSGLEQRIEAGQIAIYSHTEWYEHHRGASRTEVAKAWLAAKDDAIAKGFRGLRLTGNTAFLERCDWNDFMEYESVLREAFHRQELIALCSYNSERCDADAILDVVAAHDFALARRRGVWELVESASVKHSKEALMVLNTTLERLVEERTAKLQDALAHQQLLTAELSHRVKNTVVSLQSIAEQTLRHYEAPENARAVLRGRMAALARAHNQLAARDWTAVSLREVLSAIAAPYGERVELALDGEMLTPRATLDLGLVFHELATNAAKYGALSVEGGHVSVRIEPRKTPSAPFAICWSERGGPPAKRPKSTGFGLRLIEQLVTHDLRGETDLRFEAEGLTCVVSAPAAEILAHAPCCGHAGAH